MLDGKDLPLSASVLRAAYPYTLVWGYRVKTPPLEERRG